jgi:putative transposase
MGRPYRTALGGYVYHMLNRGNGRLRIFPKDGAYEAFEGILGEALEHVPGMRLLTYCLLPTTGTLSSGRATTVSFPTLATG